MTKSPFHSHAIHLRETGNCNHLLCTDIALKYYGCSKFRRKQCCIQFETAGRKETIVAGIVKMKDKLNIKSLGVLLFILASIFCIYEICVLEKEKPRGKRYVKHLKIVNIFSRHGDRAPSDPLPEQDRHREKVQEFWPNGLTNLTDIGRFREYMVGMEIRRHYSQGFQNLDHSNYLDYDSSKILALSSPLERCQESLEFLLKGLYNNELTKDQERSRMRKNNHLPHGSGFPNEWKRNPIDLKTLPTLSWTVLNNCKYRKEHPSPIDSDLLASPEVRFLNGVHVLKDILMKKYNVPFNYTCLGIWSTIASELNFVRTDATIEYTDHYRDWINLNVSVKGDSVLTLFDLLEQISLIAQRDRIVGEANYIQSGSLITSLIESQMVALGMNVTSDRSPKYKDKKMIIYMTHDTILQLMFYTMGIIHGDGPYEARFHKMHKSSEEAKFLNGLKMSSYGLSVRFELWEMELEGKNDKFAYVQASIYNKEDAKFHPVEFKPIELGSVCRRMFMKRYQNAGGQLSKFYDSDFTIDQKFSCPFELLRNLTAEFMIDDRKINQLCYE